MEFLMKSYRKELWFEVPTRRAFINITGDVQRCIDESGIKEGVGARQRDAYHRQRFYQ